MEISTFNAFCILGVVFTSVISILVFVYSSNLDDCNTLDDNDTYDKKKITARKD